MPTETYNQVVNIDWNAAGVQGAQALTNAVNQSDVSIQRLTQDATQATSAVGAMAAALRANVGAGGAGMGGGNNAPPPYSGMSDPRRGMNQMGGVGMFQYGPPPPTMPRPPQNQNGQDDIGRGRLREW